MWSLSKGFKKNLIVFIAILLTFLAGTFLPFFSRLLPEYINEVNFTGAQANVGRYDLSSGDRVYLTGEWEFYWDEHIVSEQSNRTAPDLYVDVPSAWTAYEINGKKLPSSGRASYKTAIDNIISVEPILVSVNNLPGKCKIFVDDVCVFSNRGIPGTVGKTNFYSKTGNYGYLVNFQTNFRCQR